MLSQVVVWRLQLFDDIWRSRTSSLESHVPVRLVHMIDVVLVLHSLSSVLILEYFCEDSFGTRWHARVIYGAVSSILYAHSSSVDGVELVFHSVSSGRALTSGCPRIIATLSHGWSLDI